jgi:hypothetical protein
MDEKPREAGIEARPDAEAPDETGPIWIERDDDGTVLEPDESVVLAQEQAEQDASAAGFAGLVQSVAGPVVGALGTVLGAADQAISGRDAIVERRLKRLNREPLANLYELYPEARLASPRELGLRFVPLEEIRGTAVAGAAQRGSDFLPLKPFRGNNWEARWKRIQAANDRLVALPPVDLVRYDDGYWVVDGHNRVAVALYANGAGLDAMVTELVPLDGQASERPSQLLGLLSEAGGMRAAAQGQRPALGMDYDSRPDRESADDEAHRKAEVEADTQSGKGTGSGEPGAPRL